MRALKVQVKNGRLVLDEPTDLPDGAEVEVIVLDDELSVEERVALHASLDRALDTPKPGPEWTQQSISGSIAPGKTSEGPTPRACAYRPASPRMHSPIGVAARTHGQA